MVAATASRVRVGSGELAISRPALVKAPSKSRASVGASSTPRSPDALAASSAGPAERAAAEQRLLDIEVTGTGARSISFGHGQPRAAIRSDGPGLVRWITHRGTWEDVGAKADGDPAALAVGRTLEVF